MKKVWGMYYDWELVFGFVMFLLVTIVAVLIMFL